MTTQTTRPGKLPPQAARAHTFHNSFRGSCRSFAHPPCAKTWTLSYRRGSLLASTSSCNGSDLHDPKPENETAGKLKPEPGCGCLVNSRRRANAEARLQRREDRVCVAAGVSGQEGQRSLPRDGRIGGGILHVAAALRRAGVKQTARVAPTARGKPQAESARGGAQPGQAHSAGSAVKKSLRPVGRRQLVRSVRETYLLSGEARLRVDWDHALVDPL